MSGRGALNAPGAPPRATKAGYAVAAVKSALRLWRLPPGRDAKKPRSGGAFLVEWVEIVKKKGRPGLGTGAATPSVAGRGALAVAFVFGPGGHDCCGIHTGKLL